MSVEHDREPPQERRAGEEAPEPLLVEGPAAPREIRDSVAPAAAKLVRRPFASALRAAGLRAALLSTLYVLVWLLFLSSGSAIFRDVPPLKVWLAGALSAVVLGLVAAPLAFVESFFARRPRAWLADCLASALVWALANAGFGIATLQIVYTMKMLESGSFERSADEVRQVLQAVLGREWVALVILAVPAAPFAPTILGRLRGLRLARQVPLSLVGGVVLALPPLWVLWVEVFHVDGDWKELGTEQVLFMGLCLFLGLVGFALLPVVLHGADALERRVSAWLAWRDAQP